MKTFLSRLTFFFALALGGVFSAPLPAEPAPTDALSGASFDLADVRSMQYRDLASDDVGDRENLQEEARPGDFVFAFEETGKNEAYLRIVLPLAEALHCVSRPPRDCEKNPLARLCADREGRAHSLRHFHGGFHGFAH